MPESEARLIRVGNMGSPSKDGNVIFVHGLNGDAFETWKTEEGAFWPEWLAAELPKFGIWSLGYPASSSSWRGDALALPQRANQVLEVLRLEGFGNTPLVFVAHSLGGLLVKSLLRSAVTLNKTAWMNLAKSTRGILFLATPHRGALLASIHNIFRLFTRSRATINDLQLRSPYLEDLNNWFGANFQELGLRGHVLREGKKTRGVWVVDSGSADPGIPDIRIIDTDCDHITICQPHGRDTLVYRTTSDFVKTCLLSQPPVLENLVRRYPLPQVNDVDCYEDLGVSLSVYVDRYRSIDKAPPYITRAIDNQLQSALETKEFVLLTGVAKAGKSRSAYEALLQKYPTAKIIIPVDPEALPRIIEKLKVSATRAVGVVLWLDDLDQYLRSGGLTAVRLVDLKELGLRLVGTMRDSEFRRFKGRANEISRDAERVLERAEVITLAAQMTRREELEARVMYPDLSFSPGLGESFIAGRELRQRYDNGKTSMVAVVQAAHDWRRMGFASFIRRSNLFDLFRLRFQILEPTQDADEQVFDEGLREALNPVVRYSALINRDRVSDKSESYSISDYVSEYLNETAGPILEGAWNIALLNLKLAADCIVVGYSAYEQGYLTVAERALTEAIRLDSENPSAYDRLALVLRKQNRRAEAEQAWRQAIRLDPNDASQVCNLANLLSELNRLDEAQELYLRARSLDPNHAKTYYNLGILFRQQGNRAEAENSYRRAIQLDPNYALAYANLGSLLIERREFVEGERLLQKAIVLHPQCAPAHCNLGVLFSERGQLDDAERAYRLSKNFDPGFAPSYYNFGNLLMNRGRFGEAEREYREAIRLDPQDSKAHNNLGLVLTHGHGSPREPEIEFREAIRLDPKNVNPYLLLVPLLLADPSRRNEGERVARRATELEPENAGAQFCLGLALMAVERWDEASIAFGEATRLEPDNDNYRGLRDLALRRRAS